MHIAILGPCTYLNTIVICTIRHFQQTIEKWRNVFLLAALLNTIGNTIFVLFGSGQVQPWNTYWEKDLDVEEKPTDKNVN